MKLGSIIIGILIEWTKCTTRPTTTLDQHHHSNTIDTIHILIPILHIHIHSMSHTITQRQFQWSFSNIITSTTITTTKNNSRISNQHSKARNITSMLTSIIPNSTMGKPINMGKPLKIIPQTDNTKNSNVHDTTRINNSSSNNRTGNGDITPKPISTTTSIRGSNLVATLH